MEKYKMTWKNIKKRMMQVFYQIYSLRKAIISTGLICLVLGSAAGYAAGVKTEKQNAQADAEVQKSNEDIKKAEAQASTAEKKAEEQAAAAVEASPAERPWNLTLVNDSHPLTVGYVPALVEVTPGYSVDERIAQPLANMLTAAAAEGMQMHICSAYRDLQYQKDVFSQTMAEHVANGLSYYDAYETTAQSVAVPGRSEHAMGLAVDIVSNEYEMLDELQATTKEAQWLAANAYKYGFILRYPPDKTQVTGIIYEPWHYRYVGEKEAKEITEQGVTFEQYLGEEE